MIKFHVNTTRVESRLAKMKSNASNTGQLLNDIGGYMLRTTQQERFGKESDPDGRKWKPLSPGYKRIKDMLRPGRPILEFDGKLKGSLKVVIEGDQVSVGTDVEYGVKHQRGFGKMPARPFLGINETDTEEILGIVTKAFLG